MKRITILLIAAFLIVGINANSQTVTSDAVVNIANVKPASAVSIEQFEAVYLEEFIPSFNKIYPSVRISLLKKIQGNRMEEYVLFKVFESLKARNQLWPKQGGSTDVAKECHKKMEETWNKLHQKASKVASTGYLVLPFQGKSLNVKSGNVVYVFECEITLEDGMTYKDLEQHYQEDYIPAFMKNFPGSQFCVLKGERGERTGKYTELIVIRSKEEFEKWNTEDGKKTKHAYKSMGEIQERMEKLCTYSDCNVYVVL